MNGRNGDFIFKSIDERYYYENPKHLDLDELYKHACSELTLQQNKRDQIIHIYILLFSLIIPLLFSLQNITLVQKGLILLLTTIIGIILSAIVVRYRIYKEAYWITCITIGQLKNIKEELISKELVQAVFYQSMSKKWSKNVHHMSNGKKYFRYWDIFYNNIFSAESLYYVMISLLTSILSGLSIFLILFSYQKLSITISVTVFAALFLFLLYIYFSNLKRVYQVLVDNKNSSFNFTFSKAWFLHFYRV